MRLGLALPLVALLFLTTRSSLATSIITHENSTLFIDGDFDDNRLVDERPLSPSSASSTPDDVYPSLEDEKSVMDIGNRNLSVENLKTEPMYKKKNLTVGYLTAIKGELKDKQGLSVSGAISMALDEVSIFFL